jgi:hypothetical protein
MKLDIRALSYIMKVMVFIGRLKERVPLTPGLPAPQ